MSTFSRRYGYAEEQGIQYESMSNSLRNRLWNIFYQAEYDGDVFSRNDNSLTRIEETMDLLGLTFEIPRSPRSRGNNVLKLKRYLFDGEWYLIYDFVEKYISLFVSSIKKEKTQEINEILEAECSGYRVIKGLVTPITNEQEIATIEKAYSTKYASVNTHISKALTLFSNRKNKDYENTTKEAISAVESLCCIIADDKKATLGDALNRLESKGVHLHKALKNAMSSLYGYTSDESGIRHGSIDFTGANCEDAKYMLISCSAFVNYLIEKWEGCHK